MPGIGDAFGSPPFLYAMCDGRVLTFNRMLSGEWGTFIDALRKELLERENAEINRVVPEKDMEQRQRARMYARDEVEKMTTLREVIRHVTSDVKGMTKLLAFALTDAKWDEVKDLIPVTDWDQIAYQIVYTPVVKLPNPSQPGGVTDTAGPTPDLKPTGDTSSASSSTSSESTQAA